MTNCLFHKKTNKQKIINNSIIQDLSNKSQTCGHPAQQHSGGRDVSTKLFAALSHWAPLYVTVGNLFTLVRITSQIEQPVNPPSET